MEKSGHSFPWTWWWDDAWRMFLVLSKYLEISMGQGNSPGKMSLRPSETKRGALSEWHALCGKHPKDHSKYIYPKESLFAI